MRSVPASPTLATVQTTIVAERIAAWAYSIRHLAGTGVVGVLVNGDGRKTTVAITKR
ncbi:hypothetical protein AAGW05_16140 [Arthrobacter sp. LAPM80]|uniref:hypothetical protein n=1 Tax=Arthrobacter sp. LAPM80 TaxID=3141788 RepID=UPI00398B0DBA